ncbi:UNVERIFIED_ORG: hypothetical protein QOE_2849 [Clostridioides difficile F501]
MFYLRCKVRACEYAASSSRARKGIPQDPFYEQMFHVKHPRYGGAARSGGRAA